MCQRARALSLCPRDLRCTCTCTCTFLVPVSRRQTNDADGNMRCCSPNDIEYRFYCEFQSHEPEFDYLKSLEIEEKINRIRWRRGRAGPLFLLSTNGMPTALTNHHVPPTECVPFYYPISRVLCRQDDKIVENL